MYVCPHLKHISPDLEECVEVVGGLCWGWVRGLKEMEDEDLRGEEWGGFPERLRGRERGGSKFEYGFICFSLPRPTYFPASCMYLQCLHIAKGGGEISHKINCGHTYLYIHKLGICI